VLVAGSATYQIWFRLPIPKLNPNINPNPNPKTDPNPNRESACDTHAPAASPKSEGWMAELAMLADR